MAIYLDTSVLPRRGRLLSPIVSALLQICQKKGIAVCLPSIVAEESVAARRMSTNQAIDELVACVSNASKYFEVQPLYLPTPDMVADEWRQELASRFSIIDINPDDAYEALVREAHRTRPARGGVGARDSAIWLTVKRGHLAGESETFLVSANTTDFGNDSGVELASELKDEVSAESRRLHYFRSIDQLIEHLASKTTFVVAPDIVQAACEELTDDIIRLLAIDDIDLTSEPWRSISIPDPNKTRTLRAYSLDESVLALLSISIVVTVINAGTPTQEEYQYDVTVRIWAEVDDANTVLLAVDLDEAKRT